MSSLCPASVICSTDLHVGIGVETHFCSDENLSTQAEALRRIKVSRTGVEVMLEAKKRNAILYVPRPAAVEAAPLGRWIVCLNAGHAIISFDFRPRAARSHIFVK